MTGKMKKDVRERLNSKIRELSAYSVPHIDCSIKLDGNESPFNVVTQMKGLYPRELADIDLNRYPDPSYQELRNKISAQAGIPPEGIVLGNGSDELIQMLIQCYTGRSGTILVPSPTFSMYRISGIAMGKEVVEVDLDESFDLDLELIKEKIGENDPDLFFFASPNNPTGNSFSEQKIIEIAESTSGVVVIDEAYFEYCGKTYLPLLKQYENVVILRTMSKIGFAALRLGILISCEDVAREINKVRLPYNINSLSAQIASRVYDNYEYINRNVGIIREEREKLYDSLGKIEGIKVYPSDANFLLISTRDSTAVFEELVKRDILVRKIDGVQMLSNCLRITVGTHDENRALVAALSDISSA